MTASRAQEPQQTRKLAAASLAGTALAEALLRTCRFATTGAEHYRRFWHEGRPVIFVLWHGRLLPCTFYHRGQGLATLVSQHGDGEIIARIVRRWDYTPVRGSSSRGGLEALRRLVRVVRQGQSLAITPDGPRGPRETMKPGPLIVAQRTGAPLVPVACGASRGRFFGRWDRFLLPAPFSKIHIEYGAPRFVPKSATADDLSRISGELESDLAALMMRVGGVQPDR